MLWACLRWFVLEGFPGWSPTAYFIARRHTWTMKQSNIPDDFHVNDFVGLLSARKAEQPMTMAFEDDWAQERQRSTSDSGRWRHNQKEHVLTWFASQVSRGAGAYSRQAPNTSSRTTYNRLMNPAMILWIAEALDEDPEVVQEAGEKALAVPSRSRAGAARKVIPWSRIVKLAHAIK